MNINSIQSNPSAFKAVGTAMSSSAIAVAEVARASVAYAQAVGMVGEIILLNLTEVRDELLAEQSLRLSNEGSTNDSSN